MERNKVGPLPLAFDIFSTLINHIIAWGNCFSKLVSLTVGSKKYINIDINKKSVLVKLRKLKTSQCRNDTYRLGCDHSL